MPGPVTDVDNHDLQQVLQREKEIRRARGDISCVECRRLKLKCDRKVPCSSCVRRHCEDLCPNGHPPASRSANTSTVNVEELQAKLDEMSGKVRELEEALRRATTSSSETSHEPSPSVPTAGPEMNEHDGATVRPEFPSELIDTLGTLTLTDGGESRFLGPSAAPETFLVTELSCYDEDDVPHHFSPDLAHASRRCPFAPSFQSQDDFRALIESHLPPYERATALCEAYLENLAWFITPIGRTQITQELLPVIYKRKKNLAPDGTEIQADAHDLALALILFACGAAGDLTQAPNNQEGLVYFHLSRAALGLRSVFANASLVTVQTMTLMGLYDFFSFRRSTMEEAWKLLSFASGIATSIGLHRDPGRWKLSEQMQERRRTVFWEIYLLDSWQTLACGRTPTFTPRSVDVKPISSVIATDEDKDNGPEGIIAPTQDKFWKYEFLRKCLGPVTDRYCGVAAPVKFYEALEFDRIINKFRTERSEKGERMEYSDPIALVTDPVVMVKSYLVRVYCDMLLLCVHRNFFARAIIDYPQNPLASPFAHSFLATFESAQDVLKILSDYIDTLLPILLRIWPYWSHMLAAGVICGSIAHRCPAFGLAQSAFEVLESAISAFERATIHPVVKNGLPVLYRLRERASKAMFDARHPSPETGAPSSEPGVKVELNENDELEILRGASRLVSQKRNYANSKTSSGGSKPGSEGSASVSPPVAQDNLPAASLSAQQSYGVSFDSTSSFDNGMPGPMSFDWLNVMDTAGMMQQDQPQGVTATSMAAAVEDGTFAILEPEAFLNPSHPNILQEQGFLQAEGQENMAVDYWNPYIEAGSAQFFGSWKF